MAVPREPCEGHLRGEGRPRGGVLAGAAAALALACAGAPTGGDPGVPVRLDGPAEVGWEPGGPFSLRFELHNASGYTLALARPRAEALELRIRRADGTVACRTPAATHRQYEAPDLVPVRAASGLPLELDVRPHCPGLSPGVYRYEAIYVANPAQGGAEAAWVGTLSPRTGRVAVGPALSRDPAALAAALSSPSVTAARPPARPSEELAPSGASAAVGSVGSVPGDVRTCLDRELARRGLNAYGDPQGTRYPAGPPADEDGRLLYVAGRSAELRQACGIAPTLPERAPGP